jgi:hypothetical protein
MAGPLDQLVRNFNGDQVPASLVITATEGRVATLQQTLDRVLELIAARAGV